MKKNIVRVVVRVLLAVAILSSREAFPTSVRKARAGGSSLLLQHLPPGNYKRHLTVGGRKRKYLLHIPSGLDPATPVPVILAFHGGYGTSEKFVKTTKLNGPAGQAGFIVAYPQGYQSSWNAGACCGPAYSKHIDDIAFVKAVLSDLASVANINQKRIFATGFSNGAMFSYRLGCELSNQFAAIATVSCPMEMVPLINAPGVPICQPERPVPVLHLHGLADKYAPFQGGLGINHKVGILPSIPMTMNFWTVNDDCMDMTKITFQHGAATCLTHPSCLGNADITLCVIQGMGHQWPGGLVRKLSVFGPGTTDISATEMLIQFFIEHPG